MNPKASRYYTYIRPILRNKFAKTYSSLIFSLITIFVFSFYAIRPTVTTILSLQKSITEQTSIQTKLQQKVSNLSQGKLNYENIDPQVKTKVNNLIPDNPDLARLVNSLNYAADQAEASVAGIQIQAVELEDKKNQLTRDAPLGQVEFTLNTQGSFPTLMKLLTKLKRTDRLFTISSVNFAQPPDSGLIMSINGKAYFVKN
ncbi:MAG TPA: type 4a pilus biogenesis protein PilO [Patescibacteria group bacterium]|nr:type 4a pilus biogenesis protein PilO [Patescibacteria group bacterium]